MVALQGRYKKTKVRYLSIPPPPQFGLFFDTYKGVPPAFFCSRLRPTKALAENIRIGDTPGNLSRDTSSRGAIVQQKIWSVSDERYIRVANASYAFEGGGAFWAAAVLKLCLVPRFPEERAYYTKFFQLAVEGHGENADCVSPSMLSSVKEDARSPKSSPPPFHTVISPLLRRVGSFGIMLRQYECESKSFAFGCRMIQ